ncbi:MAG: glycosyltransferase family 2 protein [Promethearchaeota archaeon]
MEKLVSIIILNYNDYSYTIACIKSLLNQTYHHFEIILIDNGSKFNLYLELKNKIKQFEYKLVIKLVRNERNLYFGGGSNKGIKIAKGDYICLLNNDTIVMPDFIEKMVNFLEKHPEAGMITPKIKFNKHKEYIWNAGAFINYRTTIVVINRGYLDYDPMNEKYNNITKIDFAPGTAVFLKKQIVDEIGLMDEIFLMYHEDPDWNIRAQQKGYISYYVPTTIVYHDVPIKNNENRQLFNSYFFKRNSQIMVWKYATFHNVIIFNVLFFYSILWQIITAIFLGKMKELFFSLKAIWQGFIIGIKRRTNRSCKKNLIKNYYFVKNLQTF